MPVQHSSFNALQDVPSIGKFSLLPLRTKFRGPAYPTDEYDIVDEVLELYRVNSFFRNFEIQGNADRTLLYGILFVNECLVKIRASSPTLNEANKQLNIIASDNFSIPGEPGFPLNAIYAVPHTHDQDNLRGYLAQFRQELALRLLGYVYQEPTPSKYWLAFTRKQFMGLSLK